MDASRQASAIVGNYVSVISHLNWRLSSTGSHCVYHLRYSTFVKFLGETKHIEYLWIKLTNLILLKIT